jgi:uncharacterized membrane protein YcjF (UPF0283 family)
MMGLLFGMAIISTNIALIVSNDYNKTCGERCVANVVMLIVIVAFSTFLVSNILDVRRRCRLVTVDQPQNNMSPMYNTVLMIVSSVLMGIIVVVNLRTALIMDMHVQHSWKLPARCMTGISAFVGVQLGGIMVKMLRIIRLSTRRLTIISEGLPDE